MANPRLDTLTDDFTASTLNTGLWTVNTGPATLDTVNDQVTIPVPTTSGGIATLGTSAVYDATGSAVFAQVGVAANGNGGTKTILRVRVDGSNSATMRVESGVFKLAMVTGGVTTSTTLPTYDPDAHRWWRLRESSGSFYADTSPDGLTWTNLASAAYTWSATAVTVRFESQASVTEVAGNVSVIAHVGTRTGGPLNLNWPRMEHGWGALWNANGGDSPLDRYVDLTARTRDTVSVQRGRQYELDLVRSGTLDATISDTDGSLDPSNAAGPWFGHIKPYQPYRLRGQWPATINMLTQVQATGGDLGGYAAGTIPGGNNGIDVFSATDAAGGSIVASATAWQGARCFQFSVPSATAASTRIVYTSQPAVQAGATYTAQLRVRNVTASTSLQVKAAVGFYPTAPVGPPTSFVYGSTVTLTGSATAGWTLVTVTATVPTGTAGIMCGVSTDATAAATCSVQVDGWQLERAATASAWVCPGVTSPVYAGYAERYPQKWTMNGTYGLVDTTATDAFSLLSQRQLRDPLSQEIYSRSPRFLYALGDPAGSAGFSDSTGTYPAAQTAISKYGAGSLVAGTAITATNPTTGVYTGSSGTVVTLNNPNPGTYTTSGATYISLGSAGILGPATTVWTRMLAVRYTGGTPAAVATLWSSFDQQRASGNPSGSRILLEINGSGVVTLTLSGPNGVNTPLPAGSTNICDGNWHLIIFGQDPGSTYAFVNLDGTTYGYSVAASYAPTGLVSDNIGSWVDPTVGNGTVRNVKGDISFAAEFPSLLTNMGDLYAAWKSSCAGDSTNARYARILTWGGYTGPSSVQTGLTTSMGPAAVDGQDVLSALQAVVDTENGVHFVDRAGTVTFQSRAARYNALTPVYVFGERDDLGEVPYEDVTLDYDPTHVANQISVTQASTGQVFSAQDATSITDYFPRTLPRTVNSSSAGECQDAAGYLLSRYKQPAMRVSSIRLHPSANPGLLWPVCLGLELGTRVRVMRRPPAPAPPITVDCFVEAISWTMDNKADAQVTLQCSPVDLTPYGIFASLHTTLATSPSAGVTTVTLNHGQDNTNPAAAQIGQGQQLVLGLGTANQETVTVLSVAATTAGWSTVVVTLQAATANAHTVGDVVCEPLPAGTTDPATWDASAAFNAMNFAY